MLNIYYSQAYPVSVTPCRENEAKRGVTILFDNCVNIYSHV